MRRRPRIQHFRRHAQGLAAVELALLVPIFLFLMAGTAEFGRALYQFNTLSKSVRDGAQYLARYGVLTGTQILAPTDAQLAIAKNLVVYGQPVAGSTLLPGMTTSNVTIVAQTVAPSATANYIQITATFTFQSMFSGIIPGFGVLAAAPGTFTATIRMKGL